MARTIMVVSRCRGNSPTLPTTSNSFQEHRPLATADFTDCAGNTPSDPDALWQRGYCSHFFFSGSEPRELTASEAIVRVPTTSAPSSTKNLGLWLGAAFAGSWS